MPLFVFILNSFKAGKYYKDVISLQRNITNYYCFELEYFRQQRLQFRPPFEEVKAKYFREMKKFISIPNHFKGVGDSTENTIYAIMIDRNAEGFITCYKKADELFKRLAAILALFKVSSSVYGEIDVETTYHSSWSCP